MLRVSTTGGQTFRLARRSRSNAWWWSVRGIAGLTLASALAHGGVECAVVEARDRIGGRLHTVDLAGSPVDLGGSWIHTPVGNPMRAFAQQVGVACRSANPLPEVAGFDRAEGRRLSAAEVEASLSMQFEGFPYAMGRLLAELGPDASAADGINLRLGATRVLDTRLVLLEYLPEAPG